jgi:hypothetical protein
MCMHWAMPIEADSNFKARCIMIKCVGSLLMDAASACHTAHGESVGVISLILR